MARYLLIESRDPFESNDVPGYYNLAAGLADAGGEVTMFLVQNGVLAARRAAQGNELAGLARAGVEVLADDFSLRERAIGEADLAPGIAPAPLDRIIDAMADGAKALWH